jgi:hypothetical protein
MPANPYNIPNGGTEAKVYGLIIENADSMFLSVQYAYSLEDAFAMAKLEFQKQNLSKLGFLNTSIGSKIGLFAVKELKDLLVDPKIIRNNLEEKKNGLAKIFETFSEQEKIKTVETKKEEDTISKKEKDQTTRSKLMKRIIEEKNKKLFDLTKLMFSKAECQYIEERIK